MEKHAKADDISYPTMGESLSQVEKAQTQDKKARKQELTARANEMRTMIPELVNLETKLSLVLDEDDEQELPGITSHLKKLGI